MNISSGKTYQINNTDVLSSTTLGGAVTNSSLTNVGTLTGGTWNANIIGAIYGGTGLSGYTTGDMLYASGTNTLSALAGGAGNNGKILTVSGGIPTWTSTSSVNFWQRNNGTVAPLNITDDLLLGATATSGAKFALMNVASGTPTASVSAGAAGGVYLTADGTLATTTKQTLTLGSASTGNVAINGFGAGVLHSNASGILSSGVVTNAELQNSSVTITAGTGLTGGGGVALGSSVTLNNSGVLSIIGATSGSAISGALTLNNAQTAGTTITIDNASTVAKGIASFNSANFSTATGAVSIATGGVGAAEIASTAVTGGTYGNANNGAAQFTVDADGRLTSASNRALDLGTGDVTGILTSAKGGTGINTSASTGVGYISAGSWSIDANALAATHGGTAQTAVAAGDLLYGSAVNQTD